MRTGKIYRKGIKMATKLPFGFKYQIKEAKKSTPTGEKYQMEHEAKMLENGKRILTKTVKKNIYEMIQASREQTEIDRIVRRAMEGDPSVLSYMNGVYADLTDAPTSLAQAQQIMINAKREYENLPLDVKEKFHNNYEEYIAEVGSKGWFDKMGITAAQEEQRLAAEREKQFKVDMAAAMKNLAGQATVTNMEGVKAND